MGDLGRRPHHRDNATSVRPWLRLPDMSLRTRVVTRAAGVFRTHCICPTSSALGGQTPGPLDPTLTGPARKAAVLDKSACSFALSSGQAHAHWVRYTLDASRIGRFNQRLGTLCNGVCFKRRTTRHIGWCMVIGQCHGNCTTLPICVLCLTFALTRRALQTPCIKSLLTPHELSDAEAACSCRETTPPV